MEYLLTINDLKQLNSNYQGYIVGNQKYAVSLPCYFDKVIADNLYVMVNKVFHNDELEDLEKYLHTLTNAKGIIFRDLAVYHLALKLNLTNKLIYNPSTLITNTMELRFWEERNIKGIFISPFISYEELKKFKSDKLEIYFLGNGRIPLFYSKRKLITNYGLYHNIDIKDEKFYLKEELRDSHYPIVEDCNGTFIYSPYIFSSLAYDLEGIVDKMVIDLTYDNEYIKGDSAGFLEEKIVYRKE